jgi:hypothetical protein
MNTLALILLLIFSVGIIASGLWLLLRTANQKLPKVNKDNNASYDRFDEDD